MSKISVKPMFAGKQIIYKGKPVVLSTNPTVRDLAVYRTMVKEGYDAYFNGTADISKVAPFGITKLNGQKIAPKKVVNNNGKKPTSGVDFSASAEDLIKQARAAYLSENDLMTVPAKNLKALNTALGITVKANILETFKALHDSH